MIAAFFVVTGAYILGFWVVVGVTVSQAVANGFLAIARRLR